MSLLPYAGYIINAVVIVVAVVVLVLIWRTDLTTSAAKRRHSLGCPAGWIRFRLENPDRYYAMPEWSPMLVLGVHVRADEVNVGDEICVVRSDGASDRGSVMEIVKVDRPATLEKS